MNISHKHKKHRFGFTLVELLVVISILGILSTMFYGNFVSSRQKARDAQRKSDLKQMSSMLEVYYNDFGKYPTSSGGKMVPSWSATPNPIPVNWGDSFASSTVTYMNTLPKDPSSDRFYFYESDENGTYYRIYTAIENTSDTQLSGYSTVNTRVASSTTISCSTSSSVKCNFDITSPNVTP